MPQIDESSAHCPLSVYRALEQLYEPSLSDNVLQESLVLRDELEEEHLIRTEIKNVRTEDDVDIADCENSVSTKKLDDNNTTTDNTTNNSAKSDTSSKFSKFFRRKNFTSFLRRFI